jgi:hypothetical protein
MRAVISLFVLVACGGDDGVAIPDAAAGDAAIDTPGFSMTCTGACQTTALTAAMQSTRVLDHAYFGITAADNTLHVEAYKGGAAGCPTMNSPTPDYTVVLGRVTRPTSTATSTSPGNILDYQGDLLPNSSIGQQASSVVLTPVAASGDTFVAFDVMLTFPAGTVTGHFYATHCASLDG